MELFSRSIIGIEMDSREIRAVELKGKQKAPKVTAWGKVSLPEGIIKDGRVTDKKLLVELLIKVINENGFKSKDVILGVNNQEVIVRFASFPKVTNDKIKSMVKFQAQDHIPVPVSDLELDYIVAGESTTGKGEYLNIILIGAKKNMLNDFVDVFSEAHLNVSEIDSSMLALGRAAIIDSHDGNFILVMFNHDIGNILIFKDGILGMARTVSISQTNQEAESIADVLYGEIRSSVNYYKMQNNQVIDNILLFGTCENQHLVASRLREIFGLSVQVPEAYQDLVNRVTKGNMKVFHPSEYTACISLALRGLGE